MGHRPPPWAPALLVGPLVLLAACGPSTGPEGPDDLVLQVEEIGGYVDQASLATRLPVVSVYADGRVLTEVPPPLDAVHPLPALRVVQVQRVDAAGVATLVQLARDAGVGEDVDTGEPLLTDATTHRFTVVTGWGRDELDAYALREASSGGDLTAEQGAARGELLGLLAALTDLPATLGAQAVTAAQPYAPSALAAIAEAWEDPGPEHSPLIDVPWPGPDLPGELLPDTDQVGCLAVTGAETEAVLAAGAGATAATPWVSGGQRWSVALRPPLPDERGCEDLQLS